jgi:hypothetical protein
MGSPTRSFSWRKALTFVETDPNWKLKILIGGLLFIPFPPLGWLFALGFRSVTGSRLIEGLEPVLPEWRDGPMRMLLRGLGASGVILMYLTPFFFAYWICGLSGGADLFDHWPEILVFFLLIALLPPLFLPLLTLGYPAQFGWLHFTPVEIVILIGIFAATIFIMPAVFVQVALRGGYHGALHFVDALLFIRKNLASYLNAWILSLLVSVGAIALGPFAPWGIFWSYLVILFAFNETLSNWQRADVQERFKNTKLLSRQNG